MGGYYRCRDGFAIHQYESALGIHRSPTRQHPPSTPPCPPYSQIVTEPPRFRALLHTSKLRWSHPYLTNMIMCKFQCPYSLKSSHPHLLLPLSQKFLFFTSASPLL